MVKFVWARSENRVTNSAHVAAGWGKQVVVTQVWTQIEVIIWINKYICDLTLSISNTRAIILDLLTPSNDSLKGLAFSSKCHSTILSSLSSSLGQKPNLQKYILFMSRSFLRDLEMPLQANSFSWPSGARGWDGHRGRHSALLAGIILTLNLAKTCLPDNYNKHCKVIISCSDIHF